MSESIMPQHFINEQSNHDSPIANSEPNIDPQTSPAENTWGKTWHKVEHWLKKEEEGGGNGLLEKSPDAWMDERETNNTPQFGKTISALSRPTKNLARQNSEMRERLCVYEPNAEERRALSVGRRTASSQVRSLSPNPYSLQPSHSAPDISQMSSYYKEASMDTLNLATIDVSDNEAFRQSISQAETRQDEGSVSSKAMSIFEECDVDDDDDYAEMQEELEAKWILNLSMHFKDRSDREKFFITYAEHPNKWRRITVSIDYRNPEFDSLESDLKGLRYQRDKSARIYDSIRDSLLDIQFYPTVTNLKLNTMEGRLHVHCSEDLNEIITYPKASMLEYLPFPVFREADVSFQAHISGFVYKVVVDGRVMVKKEIPGPESVDEFLYEVAALSSLRSSNHVVDFEGLVVDESDDSVKGLLISFASKGALVDLIYDGRRSSTLPWSRREKWARQIVLGLSEIHEAGFVQGDFTLSNIVADNEDNVWLVDINRRGCPVGWEPPELEALIQAGQHISMFIGVKTDLFQLGMVLWALANCIDEPERESRPLAPVARPDVPEYYRHIVDICLQADPRKRLSALSLLTLFPTAMEEATIGPEQFGSLHPPSTDESNSAFRGESIKLALKPDSRDPKLSAPSQISEISSVNTNETNTVASSEYMFEPSGARREYTRDLSPMTQSDCERPRTRDDCEFATPVYASSLDKSLPYRAGPSVHEAEFSLSDSEGNNVQTPTPIDFQWPRNLAP